MSWSLTLDILWFLARVLFFGAMAVALIKIIADVWPKKESEKDSKKKSKDSK